MDKNLVNCPYWGMVISLQIGIYDGYGFPVVGWWSYPYNPPQQEELENCDLPGIGPGPYLSAEIDRLGLTPEESEESVNFSWERWWTDEACSTMGVPWGVHLISDHPRAPGPHPRLMGVCSKHAPRKKERTFVFDAVPLWDSWWLLKDYSQIGWFP